MKKRILCIIVAIIVVIGIVVTYIYGFNVSTIYSNNKQIDILIGKEFENKDIKNIVKEVIGDKDIIIQKVELYKDMVSITTKELSDEQLEQINTKINEKYGIENKIEDIDIVKDTNIKISDMLKPYIIPLLIVGILIVIYSFIRFKSIINTFKIVGINIIVQAIYFSIISIIRIPFGIIIIPLAIALGIITTYLVFNNYEKRLEKEISEKK